MLVRKEMEGIEPYSWEKSSREIAQEFNISIENVVRFDLNTSPSIPKELLQKAAEILPQLRIHEYPDTSYLELRRLLANYCSLDTDQIAVTNGADEALDIVSKVFLDSGSNVVVSDPTYTMFRIVSRIMGSRVKGVLRNRDLTDNFDRIKSSIDEETRIVFLCSPNNPTGTCISRTDLTELLGSLECAVVVDEAYYEFAGKSFVDLTRRFDNLIVLRTFSKAFSLAGARVGYICASKETIGLLNKVRPPNSLTVFSLELAKLALENRRLMEANVSSILAARESLRTSLEEIGLRVYSSEANFLLVDFGKQSPKSIQRELMKRGIVVRDVSSMPLLKSCLRITVLKEEHNRRLIQALAVVLSS